MHEIPTRHSRQEKAAGRTVSGTERTLDIVASETAGQTLHSDAEIRERVTDGVDKLHQARMRLFQLLDR